MTNPDLSLADFIRHELPAWVRTTSAVAATVRAMPLPSNMSLRGAAVEWLLADAVAAAHWSIVPAHIRAEFDGTAGDHGADALGADPVIGFVLWQFKWYAPGRSAGCAARAQLKLLAIDTAQRLESRVTAAFGLRAGMRPYPYTSARALECFHRSIGIVQYFDYADIGVEAVPDEPITQDDDGELDSIDRRAVAGARPAIAAAVAAAQARLTAADLRCAPQREAIDAVMGKYLAGDPIALVTMATGTGKSRVAEGVASRVMSRAAADPDRTRRPVLVVAPRLEILGGLAGAFANAGWDVFRVGNGVGWPTDRAIGGRLEIGRRCVIVASAQSLDGHMPPGADFALVVRDEAHNGTGLAALTAHRGARTAPLLLLTATPDGNGLPAGTPAPVFQLLFPQAVALALVCDPVFMFVGFETVPTPATLAADLLARPFHSILVVYNSQVGALALWRALEERARRVAGLFISSDASSADPLGEFRSGAIRILVAVDKVGMGVDVPRCDAVVVAEPRGSAVDLAQLFGRACRLCPETKPDRKFTVMLPRSIEALADADASAAELAGALRIVFDGVPPAGAIRVVPAAGVRQPHRENEAGPAFEKIAERIFDSSARAIEPRAAQLRREYDRCRAMIAACVEAVPGQRSPTAAWLAKLCLTHPEEFSEFPNDPANYFAELFTPGGFPWSEFTGVAEPTVDDYMAFLGGLVRDDPAGAADLLATNPDGVIASARGFGIPPGRDPLADMAAMLGKK